MVRVRGEEGRRRAALQMGDLLEVLALPAVHARSLLIVHFAVTTRYRGDHLAGVLDAIHARACDGFGDLERIDFLVRRYRDRFEADL